MTVLTERPVADLAGLRARFPGPQLEMTIASILEGNTPARLWSDSKAALLWDQGNNVFYLTRRSPEGEVALHLTDLARQRGRRYFRARALIPGGEDLLERLVAPVRLHPVGKRFYRYTLPAPGPVPEPDGVSFVPIDGVLLRTRGLRGVEEVRREIGLMWPSLERFCERGFGVAAIAGSAIVCWCTAEYVSARACGIGIETAEAWQNHGIATAAARRLVRTALARGVTPHWECNAENLPSLRVAEKVGFTFLEETTFHAGVF